MFFVNKLCDVIKYNRKAFSPLLFKFALGFAVTKIQEKTKWD